ncbi:putative pectinesterase/pectinesterase inhibitor 38 [Impatiens glandulifera]|uniref:putative pectinesterase/pectinesterase inhibitor 38 n=1 Tax=Impatiens glandulifera TaxID=253017 RepID=UPI001FB11C0D|nr:putative pectinesterase/pectinesterase inhibitor 38 [Impatiens glandulifera]
MGAWFDCSNLYDLATLQLNNTLYVSNNHTDSDTQSWLSAASTNILICEREISQIINHITPLSRNNITALIRNSLTINHEWSEQAVDHNIRQHIPNKLVLGNEKKSTKWTSIFSKVDIVVAKDGTGNYKTIQEAITTLRRWKRKDDMKYVISIKSGVYHENILIPKNLNNVVMVGDGIKKTIITGERSEPKGFSLIGSATFAVQGSGFIAQGITFRNTAGPKGGQGVAMASFSDHSVFYRCSFEGYQDTLYAASGRQLYRECFIIGTVDFIFGNAAAVFQKCTIKTMNRALAVITAQSREFTYENTGFSFQYSLIIPSNNTFLGRPWRNHARVAFLQSFFNKQINPAGWLKFAGSSDVNNLCYREYKNFGPGSSTRKRVNWKSYRVMGDIEAQQYTVPKLIDGWSWLPDTLVFE